VTIENAASEGSGATAAGGAASDEDKPSDAAGTVRPLEVKVPGQAPTETHAEVEAETHVAHRGKNSSLVRKRQALHGVDMKSPRK